MLQIFQTTRRFTFFNTFVILAFKHDKKSHLRKTKSVEEYKYICSTEKININSHIM